MCGYTVAQNPPSVRIWPVRASECSAGQGDSGSGIVTKLEMEDFVTKKVWEHEPELHAEFDKIWDERRASILAEFDDKAFIAAAEENMTEEEKRQPLFIAYRASTKPEAERTVLERTYYKMFASAFDLVSALQENATKKIKKGRKRK